MTTSSQPEAPPTTFTPSDSDVDALEGLLELASDLSDNERRARFLLSTDWMRERAGEQVEHAAERMFAGVELDFLHQMRHVASWVLRERSKTIPIVHPNWCDHSLCSMDYDPDKTHPEDWASFHESLSVDAWRLDGAQDDLSVFVRGARHVVPDRDWPDEIVATNTDPGNMGGVRLPVADARRLATALLAACDVAEGNR